MTAAVIALAVLAALEVLHHHEPLRPRRHHP
jgi:hypothetical protein